MGKYPISIKEPASFRDPDGFVFYREKTIFRQINYSYRANYDLLISSGLYAALLKKGLLIEHEQSDIAYAADPENAYKIIKPERIHFISYPYEWCFSQLKNAALTILEIQEMAMNFGMTLKDASAYNIQFANEHPILIDTLSFEKYQKGEPWQAYRQFCQHFLAPIALMAHTDIRLNQLLRVYIDGIPLDLVSRLLPTITWLHFTLLTHIHLHAKSQKHYERKLMRPARRDISFASRFGLIDSLKSAIRKLKWRPAGTQWADYYEHTNYSKESFDEKKKIVSAFLNECDPKSVWDLGANTGQFSRLSSKKQIPTIAFDIDPACVEKNYIEVVKKKETNLTPLLLDLTNPSPGIGWGNNERKTISDRGPADVILALAFIHHLAVANNVPFNLLADFFASLCRFLIIEFIPKDDSQVQKLLFSRKDVFFNYSRKAFEAAFQDRFATLYCESITNSRRWLYLMKNKSYDS